MESSASIGAKLAALRKIVTNNCAFCGKEIEGLKTRKYCNESCKQGAKNARNRSKKIDNE